MGTFSKVGYPALCGGHTAVRDILLWGRCEQPFRIHSCGCPTVVTAQRERSATIATSDVTAGTHWQRTGRRSRRMRVIRGPDDVFLMPTAPVLIFTSVVLTPCRCINTYGDATTSILSLNAAVCRHALSHHVANHHVST